MLLLPCSLGEEGGVVGTVDCCILLRELYVIVVIFQSLWPCKEADGKAPVAFLLLIRLNITVLVMRALYAHMEACQENAAPWNLSSLVLNIHCFF